MDSGGMAPLTNNILQAWIEKMHVGRIFGALAMAFSHINYEILLPTLQHCDIQGVNINWLNCTYSTGCKGWSQKFKVLKLITPAGKLYNMGPSGISFRTIAYHNINNMEYMLVLDLKFMQRFIQEIWYLNCSLSISFFFFLN